MKVGTDGILLGAWAADNRAVSKQVHPSQIVDAGSGSGLIALMLACRFPDSSVTAIEIDEEAAAQATENFLQSPWSDRLNLVNSSIAEYVSSANAPLPDLIVCNPPFFAALTRSAEPRRDAARHEHTMTINGLLQDATEMAGQGTRFSVILPHSRETEFLEYAARLGWSVDRLTRVKSFRDRLSHRSLIELNRGAVHQPQFEELVIYDGNGKYTEEYWAFTGSFYLDRTT